MGFHLLDRITAYDKGRSARGVKVVPFGDDRLVTAPSGRRIFPRTLVLEAIVQLASRTLAASRDFAVVPVLGRMERVAFHGDALPGDSIELEVTIAGLNDDGASIDGAARVGGETIAEVRGLLCPFIETEQLVDTGLARRVFDELSRRGCA